MEKTKTGRRACALLLLTMLCMALMMAWNASPAFADDDESSQEVGMSTQAMTTSLESIESYAGDTMYETAVAEAEAAYPDGCDTAIIVGPGDAWVDALSVVGLSASKGPILFTNQDHLNESTEAALRELGVESVIIVGGTAAVSDQVVTDLNSAGISLEERIWGQDARATQLAIYNYGVEKDYWNSSYIFIATGSTFQDALSIAPEAYAEKAPIFLTDGSGNLNTAQKQTFAQATNGESSPALVILGGTEAVSERTEWFVQAAAYNAESTCERVWGDNAYDTSAEIANWAVDKLDFQWDHAAFATGTLPYDALAGSVLQGQTRSVLLLVDQTTDATVAAINDNRDDVTHICFFGGTAVISPALRSYIIDVLSDEYRIMGTTSATAQQMVDFFNSKGMDYPSVYASKGAATIDDFCTQLVEEANSEGVKAEVVFCQAMLETGWLQFGGDVKADQCNFAGLGATGNGEPGNSFDTVSEGLLAQVQHLKAYASTDDLNEDCVDLRFGYVTRGSAFTVEQLSGKWAVPGVGYGEKIVDLITELKEY